MSNKKSRCSLNKRDNKRKEVFFMTSIERGVIEGNNGESVRCLTTEYNVETSTIYNLIKLKDDFFFCSNNNNQNLKKNE